jgi:hypothetical protein
MDSYSPGFIGGRPRQTGEISDEEKARMAMHQGYLMGSFEEALAIFNELDDPFYVAVLCGVPLTLGAFTFAAGSFLPLFRASERAFEMARTLGNQVSVGKWLRNLCRDAFSARESGAGTRV